MAPHKMAESDLWNLRMLPYMAREVTDLRGGSCIIWTLNAIVCSHKKEAEGVLRETQHTEEGLVKTEAEIGLMQPQA